MKDKKILKIIIPLVIFVVIFLLIYLVIIPLTAPRYGNVCNSMGEGWHESTVTNEDNSKYYVCCPKEVSKKLKYNNENIDKCIKVQ